MKRLQHWINNKLFDVAAAPVILVAVGFPLLIAALAIGVVVIAFRLILNALNKNKKEHDSHDEPHD